MFEKFAKSGIGRNFVYFIKWCVIAYIVGACGGLLGGSFALAISKVTHLRLFYPCLLYLMPVAGLFIVWLYRVTGEDKSKGTNMVLASISSDEPISKGTGPLIYIATVCTHLVGGSAGREGAALQLGGWIGYLVGRFPFLKLDEKEKKIVIMCGMSAVFAALFGTPVAAAFFCMEVVSIGIFHYSAMLPCCLAAFLGRDIAQSLGAKPEIYSIIYVPSLTIKTVQPIVILGLLLSVLSVVFVLVLHGTEHQLKKWFPNPYIRVLVASGVFILLTVIVGSREYCGSSISIIEHSLGGNIQWEAFILKLIFTAIALGGGFKGGEIVPTLCVGAAFGATIGNLLGFNPSLMSACGMVGLFAAVTNAPIASILIGLELFQGKGIAFFAAVVSISFTLSGYYSLYSTQKFMYGKLKNVYLNRESNH